MPTPTLPGEPVLPSASPRGSGWFRGTQNSGWPRRAQHLAVAWVWSEPAAAQAIILAFIALGIAFGWWHWNNGQTGAVIGITAALLGMFVRALVTPLARRPGRGAEPAAQAGEITGPAGGAYEPDSGA
jgi:hypothetical protein